LRHAATDAAKAAGNKAEAKPVGRVQLWVQNIGAVWRRSSWEERFVQLRTFAIVGGTLFSVSVVVNMFYKTGMWAVNITAYQAFQWGAAVGAISAGSLVLAAVNVRRLFQVRPDPIYRMVLKFLNRDARVVAALGKPLKTGKFRAYRYETRFPTQKLQLVFDITGQHHDAKCSVEVSRTLRGAFDFQLLAVDVRDTGERILLNGDGSRELGGSVKGLK